MLVIFRDKMAVDMYKQKTSVKTEHGLQIHKSEKNEAIQAPQPWTKISCMFSDETCRLFSEYQDMSINQTCPKYRVNTDQLHQKSRNKTNVNDINRLMM